MCGEVNNGCGYANETRAVGSRKIKGCAEDAQRKKILEIKEAKEWLLSAADDHEAEADRQRNLMFSEAEANTAAQHVADDVTAAILGDLQVANVLIAAGIVLEETDAKSDLVLLDRALFQLEEPGTFVAQSIVERAFATELVHSQDLAAARETLRQRTEDTLNSLISHAKDAGGVVIEAIRKVDGQKLLDALARFGSPLADLPKIGSLFRKGIEKMQSALDFLTRMLNSDFVTALREKLHAVWLTIQDGSWEDALLGWAFRVKEVQLSLARAATSSLTNLMEVDRASNEMPSLSEGFGTRMKWAKGITSAVTFGGGLLLFAGVTAGASTLFVTGAYLSILAAILLIGRDCAGSGAIFHQQRGIQSIVDSLVCA